MDLTPYVDNLGREFAMLAEAGGEDARVLAERLSGALESAIRLSLLEALSAAADEITRDLAPGSVELRLRGRDPSFVVTPADRSFEDASEGDTRITQNGPVLSDAGSATEDAATARVNLRLPEPLKAAIEEAAGKEGRSVNAWLIRVASAAVQQPAHDRDVERRGKRGSQRYTGWVR